MSEPSPAASESVAPPKPPGLFSLNGVGLTLYGNRDSLPDGSYVKTRFATVFFVPVFALDSWRVMNSPGGGWFVRSKESISGLCKGLNLMVVLTGLLVAAAVALTPPAGERKLKEGREHLSAKRWSRGTKALAELLRDETYGKEARAALVELISGPLREAPSVEVADALQIFRDKPLAGELFDAKQDEAWVALAVKRGETDARGALTLLRALEPLATGKTAAAVEGLLAKVVEQNPDDLELVSQLALAYEERESAEDLKALLLPLKDKLSKASASSTEAARLLGNVLAAQGDDAGAAAIWGPYVETHLPKLKQAEEGMYAEINACQQRAIKQLNTNPPKSFTRELKEDPAAQDELVNKFVLTKINSDPAVKAAVQRNRDANRVVPVVLELGVLRLLSAQKIEDRDARTAAFKKVEDLFLSVEGAAGKNATFKLNLGKVRYWLGKSAEGKALFDELLSESKRDPKTLLAIANVLRNVGESSQAIKLTEEAYESAKEPELKQGAAGLRAIMSSDAAEELTWLERSNPTSPQGQARLAAAKGSRAFEQGKTSEAKAHFERALAAYEKLPEEASTLNNSALVLSRLWQATGKVDYLERSVAQLKRAEALSPSDSVLVGNVAGQLLSVGAVPIVGDRLDLGALRTSPSARWFRYLTDDEASLRALNERYCESPSLVEAQRRLERLRLLAPSSHGYASMQAMIVTLTEDVKAQAAFLKDLEQRKLDRSAYREQTRNSWRGQMSQPKAELEASLKTRLARLEAVSSSESANPATRALALAQRVDAQADAWHWGHEADLDALEQLAAQALELAPSLGARGTQRGVWCLRAVVRLSAANPELKASLDKLKNVFSPGELLAYWLLRGSEAAREQVAADPDLKRVASSYAKQLGGTPERGATRWLPILRACEPEAAEAVAAFLAKDELAPLGHRIGLLISPLDGGAVLGSVLLAEARGEKERATKLWAEAKAAGFPID